MGIGAKQVSPGKPGGTQGREDRARQPSGSRLEVVTANPAHQYWQVILCHSCPPWSHNTAHHGFKCDRILSSAWRAVPGNEPPSAASLPWHRRWVSTGAQATTVAGIRQVGADTLNPRRQMLIEPGICFGRPIVKTARGDTGPVADLHHRHGIAIIRHLGYNLLNQSSISRHGTTCQKHVTRGSREHAARDTAQNQSGYCVLSLNAERDEVCSSAPRDSNQRCGRITANDPNFSCHCQVCADGTQFCVGSLCFGFTIPVELGLRGSHFQHGLLERMRDFESVYKLKFRRRGYLRRGLCCRKRHRREVNGRDRTPVRVVSRALDDQDRT